MIPFDAIATKKMFQLNSSYIAFPNIAIAQLETSNIIKISKHRSYEKFMWDKDQYQFPTGINDSFLVYKCEKKRINKKLYIIGITTFNRLSYLKKCLESLYGTISNKIDYIFIVADGCSYDGTLEWLIQQTFPDNISYYVISNPNHFIYRQSNCILNFSNKFDFDLGFIINDDLIFISNGWDVKYDTAVKKHNFDHLVYFDKSFKRSKFYKINTDLQSHCDAEYCQGALFTFTKKIINTVGYFDEDNFKIRGQSHIDFTMRCCRKGYNDINTLWDIKDSEKYIILNNDSYVSSANKLPTLLREYHKVDVYELKRRTNLIKNKNRGYINPQYKIIVRCT